MSEFAQDDYEPISFSTSQPSWRALYVNPQDRTQHFVLPLIGWSLYRITIRDIDTGDQLPRARTRLDGVVLLGTDAVPASAGSAPDTEFWGYLSPEELDPEPGTAPGREPDGKGKGGKRGRGDGRGGKRGERGSG